MTPSQHWIEDCMKWWGRVLDGAHAHWCPEWDDLPIDKTCTEFECCTCEFKSAFFAGCDFGSKYAGDQYLGTPERQRGFDQWKRDEKEQ